MDQSDPYFRATSTTASRSASHRSASEGLGATSTAQPTRCRDWGCPPTRALWAAHLQPEVIRTGPATQWSSALATSNATGQALSGALTVDLSGVVNISVTATTGTAAGDLTLDFFMVEAI